MYTVSPDGQQSLKLTEIVPSKLIIPNGMLQFLGNIGQCQWGNNEVANDHMKILKTRYIFRRVWFGVQGSSEVA